MDPESSAYLPGCLGISRLISEGSVEMDEWLFRKDARTAADDVVFAKTTPFHVKSPKVGRFSGPIMLQRGEDL